MRRSRVNGFTLIEVLVALLIMAVLAALSWRGVDAMVASRDATSQALDRSTRLNTVITQWQQDLEALYDRADVPGVPTISFDGQSVRLVRTAPEGLRLVTWALRSGTWQRHVSPVTTLASALQEHWLRSQQLQGSEIEQLTLLDGLIEWQIYYFRGNAWSNAQSGAGAAALAPSPVPASAPASASASAPAPSAAGPAAEPLPSAVRLLLRWQDKTLTRDIALVPQS